MNDQGLQGAIKKYLEDRYGYDIGKVLDKLDNTGFYNDPEDMDSKEFFKEVELMASRVSLEEGIRDGESLARIVGYMIPIIMMEYAGVELNGNRMVYRP